MWPERGEGLEALTSAELAASTALAREQVASAAPVDRNRSGATVCRLL